jgi:stearoyl-CoA desaturase (Delta-9 desaturase)
MALDTRFVEVAAAPERVESREFAPRVATLSEHQRDFSAAARRFNAIAVFAPLVAFVVAVVMLWNGAIDAGILAIFLVMYFLTTIGITMGFHRLLTHRSFETHPWVRVSLAVLGSMAVEGPPIVWVADHRKHHTFADEEGDPHSPHLHAPDGIRGTLKGLYHAHFGWLLARRTPSDPLRYARDLVRDRQIRRVNDLFPWIVLLGFALPALLGFALAGTLWGAVAGFLWGGLARVFIVHHLTWSVNSLGHYFGRRRFATTDRSGNLFSLALLSLGDSWHHNHHAFPRSARHGLKWWEIDVTGALIAAMSAVGLAWDVVAIDEAQILARELVQR